MSLESAATALARGRVVAFTGAGISSESGIPTFRDPGGLWDRFDVDRFGTWEGMAREAMTRPDDLAAFLAELRATLAAARPNAGHVALAELEASGLVEAVITQNVDGLHQGAGSRRVVEVHGSVRRRVCLACGRVERVELTEFLSGLDRAVVGLRSAFVPSLASLLPRCPGCAGPMRAGIVAFGESPVDFDEALRLSRSCRCMLVVGTSGEVEPAAALPRAAREAGALVVHVGPQTLVAADVHLAGKATQLLPRLAAMTRRVAGSAEAG